MTPEPNTLRVIQLRPVAILSVGLMILGLTAFVIQAAGGHPARAWQAYLINFLLWSAIAQGGFLFSAVMHVTRARWSGSLAGIAEAFAGFFPVSFGLFLLLMLGGHHLFPWLHEDLHGKEVWLNLPFLYTRDAAGLLVLYGLGLAYLYYSLGHRLTDADLADPLRARFHRFWHRDGADPAHRASRKTVFAVLYIMAFAGVLSLLGYDLVMSMDPHWYSTLFGAYTFIKAFYVGLAGLIILAGILHFKSERPLGLRPAHFHDVGKLFFGFCLVWADFFYCQLVVIWYGNIPEETAYVIKRTMVMPYQPLAWGVFTVCFMGPFLILLNKNIKTRPAAMGVICALVLMGIWLEHLLLMGPALFPHQGGLPLGISDGVITLGFLGLMVLAVSSFIHRFPELVVPGTPPGMDKEGR